MKHLQVLTNSELETARMCGAKHGFAYQELLRPRVDGVAKPSGSILHDGIEAGWRAAWEEDDSLDHRLDRALAAGAVGVARAGREQIEKLHELDGEGADKVIETIERESSTLTWCVQNYFRAVKPDLAYVPLFIEGEFAFRVPTERSLSKVEYRGKRDLVLWDREINRLIVQDHKGTALGVRSLEKKIALDTQLSGYVFGLWRLQSSGEFFSTILGQPNVLPVVSSRVLGSADLLRASIGAIAFNVIKRKRPEVPKLNLLKKGDVKTPEQAELLALQTADKIARGEVSVRDISTTATVYRDALTEQVVERGLPITEEQRVRLAALEAKGDVFFAQLESFRGEDELERWRREVLIDAKKIRESNRGERTRNPGACTMPWSPPCAFATICQAPNDPVARAQYVVVDRPHQELDEDHGINQEEELETHDYI